MAIKGRPGARGCDQGSGTKGVLMHVCGAAKYMPCARVWVRCSVVHAAYIYIGVCDAGEDARMLACQRRSVHAVHYGTRAHLSTCGVRIAWVGYGKCIGQHTHPRLPWRRTRHCPASPHRCAVAGVPSAWRHDWPNSSATRCTWENE